MINEPQTIDLNDICDYCDLVDSKRSVCKSIVVTVDSDIDTTFFVNRLRAKYDRLIVTSPLGLIAAQNRTTTLQRLTGIPQKVYDHTRSFPSQRDRRSRINPVLRKARWLVIRDAFTLRSDQVDALDAALKHIRRSPNMYGGLRVVFIDRYNSKIDSFEHEMPKLIEFGYSASKPGLKGAKVFAQYQSDEFQLSQLQLPGSKPIQEISSANLHNDQENQSHKESSSEIIILNALKTGTIDKSDVPCLTKLKISPGASVKMLTDDSHLRWKRGDRCIFEKVDNENLILINESGDRLLVARETWSRYTVFFDKHTQSIQSEPVGNYQQYPIGF